MSLQGQKITAYGSESINKIVISLLLFVVCASTASAFVDDAERYQLYPATDYTALWNLYKYSDGPAGTSTVTTAIDPRSINGNAVLSLTEANTRTLGLPSFTSIAAVTTKDDLDQTYFSWIYAGGTWTDVSNGWMYADVRKSTDGTVLASFSVIHSDLKVGHKYEIIQSGSYFNLYDNGVQIQSVVNSAPGYTGSVHYTVGIKILAGEYRTMTGNIKLDDFTDGSIVGMQPEWHESSDNLTFTWSEQLARSYPNSTHKITLYSITGTTVGKVTSWTIPDGLYDPWDDESGYMYFNRSTVMGENYGLYLLEMTRDSTILADTFFTYSQIANPISYPDVLFLATSNVDMEIRDDSNNGRTIDGGESVYLYPATNSSGEYNFDYTLKETPYAFTAELDCVYNNTGLNSTIFNFYDLNQYYTVSLDGNVISGAYANGTLTFSGNASNGETVTIGSDVYEFDSGDGVTAGHLSVTIGNSSETAANLVTKINNNGTETVTAEYTSTGSTYYSSNITITNSPTSADSQAVFNVTHDAEMDADFSDVWFENVNGTIIPFYIENYSTSTYANIWLKLPANQTNIMMYWGAGEPESESNITNTFDFADDFSNSLSKWSGDTGYFSVSSGELRSSSSNGKIYASVSGGVNGKTVEASIKSDDTPTDLVFGLITQTSATGWQFTRRDEATHARRWGDGSSYYSTVPPQWTSGTYGRDTMYIAADGSLGSSTFYFDGTAVSGVTASSTGISAGQIGIRQIGATSTQYIDWIRVRKTLATTPTFSAGARETVDGTAQIVSVQYDVVGTAGNSVSTTETCSSAAWSSSTLTGGETGSKVDSTTWSYELTDWTNLTTHIFSFSPDLTRPGVYGYVKETSTGDPIERATITISNDTWSTAIYTDENGLYYYATGIVVGETYTLAAAKSGYTSPSTYTATTSASATTRKDMYLDQQSSGAGVYYESHDVTFKVLEYWYSSAGLPGVTYAVYNGNESVKNGTTGGKGTFTVTDMDAGKNYTFVLTYNGTSYTEYLEPGLTEYTFVLNKEGIVHQYYNNWLNLTYAETPNNATILYTSNKTVSAASLTVTASNGTIVQSNTLNTTSGTFLFNSTGGDYILQFDIEASDGSTASQAWSISSPPEVNLFPASYPTWLKNTLFVAIIIIFLLAFGKSKNDIACGTVAVLTSFGYYFEWLTCSFNFVVLIWIIALGAIYLHYKRTGAVG